ncbi:hypothetical protein C8R48DRAFT_590146, partial [Suillus tomentosus]
QPPGIFFEGKHFYPCAFLKTVKQIYKQVFLWPSGGGPALDQEAFTIILLDQSILDVLLTVYNNIKHLHIEYLQKH